MSNIKNTAKELYDSLQMSLATMDPGTAKVLGGAAGGLAGGAVGAIGGRRGRIGRMIALGLLGGAAGTAVGGEMPNVARGGLEAASDRAAESRHNRLSTPNLARFVGNSSSNAVAAILNRIAYWSEAERRAAEAQGDLVRPDQVKLSNPWLAKTWNSLERVTGWPGGVLDAGSRLARRQVERMRSEPR